MRINLTGLRRVRGQIINALAYAFERKIGHDDDGRLGDWEILDRLLCYCIYKGRQ